MTPLLKKEIRLILPVWLAVLFLELAAPWLPADPDWLSMFGPIVLFFGMILLSVDSFGREFSLGTFSALMAQPVDRRRVWQTKVLLLLAAAGLVFAVYFTSCELRLHLALTESQSVWSANPNLIRGDYAQAMGASVAVLLIALTGGLWTALLLRQVAAAFWITLMVPVGLLMLIILTLSEMFKATSDLTVEGILYGAAGLYIAVSFWLAHRLFFAAQDAGWSGGVISFDRWRYWERTTPRGESLRRHRPTVALLKKEFQLNSISLFCAGALLAVHGVVIYLRIFYTKLHPNTTVAEAADFFWVIWLVMPLVISCTMVAEERRLGVADSQLCLPVSRRRQLALKLLLAMVFGVLLGGVMPVLLEHLASQLGVTSDSFKPENHLGTAVGNGLFWFQASLLLLAAGLAAVGFLASALARNFLQALSMAITGIIGGYVLGPLLISPAYEFSAFILVGVPVMLATLLWVVYRAYCYHQELSRNGWRYLALLAGAWVLAHAGASLIYNRTWERLTPLEPAHGRAVWSGGQKPVVLRNDLLNSLLLALPDGQLWSGELVPGHRWFLANEGLWNLRQNLFIQPPPRLAQAQLFGGSEWVSVASSVRPQWFYPAYEDDWEANRPDGNREPQPNRETVAIRADGTLWVSERPGPQAWDLKHLVQFGSETNWQAVRWEAERAEVLLLKRDGTLWCWGGPYIMRNLPANWESLRATPPRQIGTDTDWQALFPAGFGAQKRDGSIACFSSDVKTGSGQMATIAAQMVMVTNAFDLSIDPLDASKLATCATANLRAGIRRDGTLWITGRLYWDAAHGVNDDETLRASAETNWVAVALSWNSMVALKADGTLWRWGGSGYFSEPAAAYTGAPQRLGSHQDWVALLQAQEGAISVAADGSLWLWRDEDDFRYAWKLMKPSQKPVLLGNVFAAASR
jgi:ABC-type transport system involved in multi-copper enzyme maturation permease subunit